VTRIVCIGECMVELRAVGADTFARSYAGDAYNTAVYLKRSLPAAQVQFLTATGDDAMSKAMRRVWRVQEIDDALAFPVPGGSAGLYLIETAASGERSFQYWRKDSAAKHWLAQLQERGESVLWGADMVYYSGITLAILDPDQRAAALELLARARPHIGRIAFDPNVRLRLWESPQVAAQTIHELSRRRKHPFLAVNCGAISPHLIESEIFGHEKGSFTGAVRQHEGFFERAHGGTLFLDEITEMPLDLQVKLLRVLETGLFMRVGSTIAQETDVRVVAASNRDPERAVVSGKLREDLLYRLNVFPIQLPPLRERMEDVSLLAQHFLAEICAAEGEKKTFSNAAMVRLQAHRWPGNVRELRNAVHRAYVMASSPVITDEWLSFDKPASVEASGPAINIRIGTALADVERTLILATLKHFDNHRERTAAALGVSLKTLYNRLKEYSADGHGGDAA